MNKINFFASEIHYFDHIMPIWAKLDDEHKGIFYVSNDVMMNRLYANDNCEIGLPNDKLTLVASFKDYQSTKGDVIFMEHGIGHNYGNKHPAYVGGVGKHRVVMFLNQHHISQHTNQLAYPKILNKIIGTPKMDNSRIMSRKMKKKPIVCISFHWDCYVCDNTRSAYYYYKDIISELAKSKEYTLVAHGHTRGNWSYLKSLDIEFIPNFSEVMEKCDIYVNDNSSSMYEFMAVGKPVIVLNCPLYDKNKDTGIRFWKYIGGKQVDNPSDLHNAILEVIAKDEYRELRSDIIEELYPMRGKSSQTAADYIKEYLDERVK